jgi:hypothetical protein
MSCAVSSAHSGLHGAHSYLHHHCHRQRRVEVACKATQQKQSAEKTLPEADAMASKRARSEAEKAGEYPQAGPVTAVIRQRNGSVVYKATV